MCHRWHRLAHHPSLLGHLLAQLGSPAQPRALFLPRLRAFVHWLRRRAAPHAVHAALTLHIPDGVSRSGLRLALAELKEVLAQACPHLASLSLEFNQEARAAGWLAQMCSLRSLRVASAERLRVSARWQVRRCGGVLWSALRRARQTGLHHGSWSQPSGIAAPSQGQSTGSSNS